MSDCVGRKLTIVVPVYNRADIIMRTLSSIASQQRIGETSIIIVDNNSSDTTPEVIRQWADSASATCPDIKILSETKRGAAVARDSGLRAVNTPYVMFFDSDDEMSPGLINTLLDAIESNPSVDIFGWSIKIQLSDGGWTRGVFKPRHPMWNHLIHGSLSTQRYCCRTELLRSVGGWRHDLPTWDDFELGVRLLLASPKMMKLPGGDLAVANFTPVSLTGSSYSAKPGTWEHALDCCEDDLKSAGFSHRWIDVRRLILAADYAGEGRPDLSDAIMGKLLKGKTMWERAAYRLLWLKQRAFPHGTARIATLFFSRDPKRMRRMN